MSKTHFKKQFNTPYLGSQDFDDYKDRVLSIEKVVAENSKGLKENDLFNIAYFKDKDTKPMLLNATNCRVLKRLAKSPLIEDWANQVITVYVLEDIKAFGGLHDGLRIRPVAPVMKKPTLNKEHKKWLDIAEKVAGGVTIDQIRKHYQITDENFKLLSE